MSCFKTPRRRRSLHHLGPIQKIQVISLLSVPHIRDPTARKIKRKREIRVFVSSTFLDMSEEREELIKKTFPLVKPLQTIHFLTISS